MWLLLLTFIKKDYIIDGRMQFWRCFILLEDVPRGKILVGVKQTKKALKEKQALKVIIADDAQMHVIGPIIEACKADNIEIERTDSMEKLGNAVNIDVGAAVVVVIK